MSRPGSGEKLGELRLLIYKFNKARSINWSLHKNKILPIIRRINVVKRQLLGSLYAPTDASRGFVVYIGSIRSERCCAWAGGGVKRWCRVNVCEESECVCSHARKPAETDDS